MAFASSAAGDTLAAIFLREKDLESFRNAVADLDGVFPFTSADMIALGEAYFKKYPDRTHDRNMEDVRLGYEIVRIAVIEKAVAGFDAVRKEAYRTILGDVANVASTIAALHRSSGTMSLSGDCVLLRSALETIKATIDEIPKGMIKERFVGGISNLFNILYVLKMSIDRMEKEKP
jgi:hypothetical protein